MRSMAMGLPSSAYWPVRSFVALFIRKHGTLDEHCKHHSCDCWAYHNMLGTSNQLSLSARSPQCKTLSIYLYNEHLCRLSWCKKYWTYCMCLTSWFFWEHISSHLLHLPFFAGSLLWFEMIWTYYFNFGPKVPLECILWYDQRCAAGRLFCPQGRDQNWVSPKLDGLRWFNLVLKPYSQLWLHGVSLYFNLESGLSLASGWNLCCAAISFIASHLSFPSVVDLLCLINLNWSIPHHGYLSMGWRRGQKIVTWPLGPNHRS